MHGAHQLQRLSWTELWGKLTCLAAAASAPHLLKKDSVKRKNGDKDDKMAYDGSRRKS